MTQLARVEYPLRRGAILIPDFPQNIRGIHDVQAFCFEPKLLQTTNQEAPLGHLARFQASNKHGPEYALEERPIAS